MQQILTRHDISLELLENLVKVHAGPVSLVVCCERKEFFGQILTQVIRSGQQPALDEIPSSQQSEDALQQTDSVPDHAFLTASLRLLSISKSVTLIYCPTVPALRASLASYDSNTVPSSQLIILDLVALHHGTSEFTLQGLSRTFASAVSAAHRVHSSLTLIECNDINDPIDPHRGSRLWDREVPLLSASVKIGQEGARWAGRSMTIRKIASRWFTFDEDKASYRRPPTRPATEDIGDEMLI